VIAALRALGLDAVRPLLAEAPGLEPIARAWALELAAELAMVGTAEGSEDPTLAAELRAALRRAAESCDEVVVLAAVRALARWAEPEDAALLVRLGARGSSAVARAASEVLEALSMAAPASVEMALADAAPDAAEAWSAAVAVLPREAALEKIRTAMSSGSPGARRAVVRVLDRLDSAEAAEIAALALTDEDFGVRVAAANVLARMHDASARTIAIRTLRLALCDSSAPVRAAAARGLGTLGDRGAVDVLRERLRDNGPEVVVAALGALRMLGMARTVDESELDEILSHVLGHRDEEVVKEALRFVAESVSARREARLSLGLRHPAWDVRQLAVTLLGEVGTPEALELLRERMAVESDDLVRASLAEVLRSKRG
jgi:HEAT repeat protein